MTFYLEPIGRIDDIELEGIDISDVKVWKDENFTAEVDTSGWSKEHWQAIFGFIPIIRCKDCKHRYIAGGYGFCEKLDDMFWHHEVQEPISPDFFCQMGERKEK